MDGREGGFIVVWRKVQSSPLFLALTAEQRSVMLSILLLANWKDRQVFVGGKWETVHRGELMQSLETIRKHAKVSVKVVRTTIAKMFADDRAAGGRGPFLTERWIGLGREVGSDLGIAPGTPPGTAAGTPIRVLTVVNYDEYQSIIEDAGTGSGTVTGSVKGTPGAREGHDRGTSRTKVTKGTIELPLVAEAAASDDAGPFEQIVEVWDRVCVPAGFAVARSTPQQRKTARARMREPGWLDAFTAACGYMAREPFYRGGSSSGWVATLGWLLKPGNAEKTAERASTTKAGANGSSQQPRFLAALGSPGNRP